MMHHRIRKIRNSRRGRRLSWLNRFRRDDRGVQLVELAIAMPIMLMLFGAAAEFGRYFYEYTTLAKAARVGVRYLATAQLNSTEETAAKNLVVYGNTTGTGTPILSGLSPTNIHIETQGGVGPRPETVSIQIVDFQHQPVFDLGKMLKW
jgi:Flp pilus assembly protein TadG